MANSPANQPLSREERARRRRQIEQNQGAIQLLRAWDAEDAALSLAQQQAALSEWATLESALDDEYRADNPLLPCLDGTAI